MVLNAGSLNRRIQIQRATKTPDGIGGFEAEWNDFGPMIYARRQDVSDSERMHADRWDNVLVTRFVIRSTAFGRGITRADRIIHEGVTFGIDGIKEVPGNRRFLEITAKSDEVA